MKPIQPQHHLSPPGLRTSGTMRRRFLQVGAAAIASGMLPLPSMRGQLAGYGLSVPNNQSAASAAAAAAGNGYVWRNWSGILQCTPRNLHTPQNEADIIKLLQGNQEALRCVGSSHSFSPLVPTDAHLLSLDRLAGVIRHDATPGKESVTVHAGTRLAQLSRQLDAQKLGMRNLPDIDMQTVAGCIATATHGTGAQLPALHADLLSLNLITAKGELLTLDASKPELFACAKVALGSLGVITQVSLRVLPAYNLQRKVWLKPVQELLDAAPELAKKHRHFEFYYLPFTGFAAAITHDLYAGDKVEMPPSQDEQMLADLKQLRDWVGRFPGLRRWLAGKFIDANLQEQASNRSWRLLSSSRPTRFNESECHLPQEQAIACVREVIAKLEQRNEVFFPMEFRYVKGDDAWLSPFYQRDSCSIAVHAAAGEAYDYLVADIGPIFRKYQGRPHWGKLHQFSARELAALYPRWKDFQEIRRTLDPNGRFLNPHLRTLFEGPV